MPPAPILRPRDQLRRGDPACFDGMRDISQPSKSASADQSLVDVGQHVAGPIASASRSPAAESTAIERVRIPTPPLARWPDRRRRQSARQRPDIDDPPRFARSSAFRRFMVDDEGVVEIGLDHLADCGAESTSGLRHLRRHRRGCRPRCGGVEPCNVETTDLIGHIEGDLRPWPVARNSATAWFHATG